jgi:hypothetical protein
VHADTQRSPRCGCARECHLLGCHLLVQGQRGQCGPLGVILLGDRGPEQRQTAIAHHGQERPAILLHGLPRQVGEPAHLLVQGIKVQTCLR